MPQPVPDIPLIFPVDSGATSPLIFLPDTVVERPSVFPGDDLLVKPVDFIHYLEVFDIQAYAKSDGSSRDSGEWVPSAWKPMEYVAENADPVSADHDFAIPVGVSVSLIVGFVLLALMLANAGGAFWRYLKTMFSRPALEDYVVEEYRGWLPPSFLLFSGLNVIMTAFTMAYMIDEGVYDEPWVAAGDALLILLLLHLLPILRSLVIRLLGSIFRMNRYASAHIVVSYNSQALLGTLLLPLVLIYFYGTEEWKNHILLASFIALIVILLYHLMRMFSLPGRKRFVYVVYNILYLCTLEIVPLLILYKAFIEDAGT